MAPFYRILDNSLTWVCSPRLALCIRVRCLVTYLVHDRFYLHIDTGKCRCTCSILNESTVSPGRNWRSPLPRGPWSSILAASTPSLKPAVIVRSVVCSLRLFTVVSRRVQRPKSDCEWRSIQSGHRRWCSCCFDSDLFELTGLEQSTSQKRPEKARKTLQHARLERRHRDLVCGKWKRRLLRGRNYVRRKID